MSLWFVRVFFLCLCTLAGYAVGQERMELAHRDLWGTSAGFTLGLLLIGIDELVKGISLRSFSAATFGLLLGALSALMVDHSHLFIWVRDPTTLWMIRLGLYLGFSYIGMVVAMRGNKEDFSLIIPFVRFSSQTKPENLILLDTSAIIDGRIADLIDANFLEGRLVRGRRGLDILNRVQGNPRVDVKIHEGDFPEESSVDAKLVRLARALGAKLYTTDHNLAKVAEIQSIPCVNLNDLSKALKPVVLPGEIFTLKIVREGRDKGQGVGYMNDGTMVVVNHAQSLVGQQTQVSVQSLLQTGAGVIIFADLKPSPAPATGG
jgi:uncharacterized protein YacL